MKLIYRGISYGYDPLKASSWPVRRATPYTLGYRGVTYDVTPRAATTTMSQTVPRQLIYRGNIYWVTRTVAAAKESSQNNLD
jgi:Domain of unknown function (DUF4278)